MRRSEISSPYQISKGGPLATAPGSVLLLFSVMFSVLASDVGMDALPALTVALMTVFGWIMIGTSEPRPSSKLVCAVLALLCVVSAVRSSSVLDDRAVFPRDVDCEADVLQVREVRGIRYATLRLRDGSDIVATLRVQRRDGPVIPGDVIRLECALDGSGRCDEARWETVGSRVTAARMRWSITRKIKETFPPLIAGYLNAIVTGERDAALQAMHRADGTAHLLAVSGFHVGVVFAIAWYLLRRVPFRLLLASLCIWVYVSFTGAAPSAVRAALMIQLALIGRAIELPGDLFNTAAVAAWMMLLYAPLLYHDMGWRLSVIAILTVTGLSSKNDVRSAAVGSVAVWIGTAPLLVSAFGPVPLVGAVINIFALPIFGAVFPMLLFTGTLVLFGMPGDWLPVTVCETMLEMWSRFSENMIYLVPWTVGPSPILYATFASVLTMICDRAAGLSLRSNIVISFCVFCFTYILAI